MPVEEPLSQVATVLKADLGLNLGLDSFGDDLNALTRDRSQERSHHFPACLRAPHGLNEISVELEKVRRAFGDFQQPGLTDAEIVIGQLDPQLFQQTLDRSQLGDADPRLFRDFDDELMTPAIEPSELVQRIEIFRPGQLRGVEIDEESKPRGQHGPDLQRLGSEQAAQVAFHLTFLGELKELGGALM